MKTGIHIGTDVDEQFVANITSGIERVFKSGSETHQTPETIQHAISAFAMAAKSEISNVSISNVSVNNDGITEGLK